MNINDLTIGQAKQLAAMFAPPAGHSTPDLSPLLGKYVIIRSRDSGVHAGILQYHAGREVRLSASRRLWYWVAAQGHTLSAVALYGLKDTSKITDPVAEIAILDACEIIPTTETAEASIREVKSHAPR